MLADMLTKEMKMPESVLNLMTKNKLELPTSDVNIVRAVKDELRMYNIRNRNDTLKKGTNGKEEDGEMSDI